MNLPLSEEQQRVVGQAVKAGLIRSSDEVVEVGVAAIRSRLQEQGFSPNEVWLAELTAWFHGHASKTPLLSDEAITRESIYQSRGA